MAEKEYAQGIYVKKFTNKYGDWISVSIKDGDEYKRYKFYPKKEQKSDKYVEFYGIVDDWKPESKPKQDDETDETEIPF